MRKIILTMIAVLTGITLSYAESCKDSPVKVEYKDDIPNCTTHKRTCCDDGTWSDWDRECSVCSEEKKENICGNGKMVYSICNKDTNYKWVYQCVCPGVVTGNPERGYTLTNESETLHCKQCTSEDLFQKFEPYSSSPGANATTIGFCCQKNTAPTYFLPGEVKSSETVVTGSDCPSACNNIANRWIKKNKLEPPNLDEEYSQVKSGECKLFDYGGSSPIFFGLDHNDMSGTYWPRYLSEESCKDVREHGLGYWDSRQLECGVWYNKICCQ